MATPKVTITGTDALLKTMRRLPLAASAAIEKVALKTAFNINRTAKTLCPVDTGRLRASISVNWTGSRLEKGALSGKTTSRIGSKPSSSEDGVGNPGAGEGFIAVVGTNVEYAEDVENNISPYLWPAFSQHKVGYMNELKRILWQDLQLAPTKPNSFFGRPNVTTF